MVIGQPEEIASAGLWLCMPGASFVIGHALVVVIVDLLNNKKLEKVNHFKEMNDAYWLTNSVF